MTSLAIQKRAVHGTLIGLFLVTAIVTPWANLDPINLPKFALLLSVSLYILGVVLSQKPTSFFQNRTSIFVAILFAVGLFSSFFFHGTQIQHLYGTFGRNTGLLAYLALLIIFLVVSNISQIDFGKSLLITLFFCSLMQILYGVLQASGLDPITWNNLYGPIIGTLGNPNFMSAFLGMSAVASLSLALNSYKLFIRVALLVQPLAALVLILKSDSIQGLFVLAIGFVFIAYLRFFRFAKLFFKLSFLLLVSLGFLFTLMGIFNHGPLSSLLYQGSVRARAFYWSAAIEMAKENPIFGVGLDSYGFFYRTYRSEESTGVYGAELVTNSAHNVFLDILTYGGIPLLASYILILLLALKSAVVIVSGKKIYDATAVGLVSCWFGYILQSLVSINNLGLAVWGWAISGALISYESYIRFESNKVKPLNQLALNPLAVIFGALGVSLSLVISTPLLAKDSHFRGALENLDSDEVIKASQRWPKQTYYLDYGSNVFLDSGLFKEAKYLAEESVDLNPQNFDGWRLIYLNPITSDKEKSKALKEMKRIDPLLP